MSRATRKDARSPAVHVADSHDLIRVHGARVNNLKDVRVELSKRRGRPWTGTATRPLAARPASQSGTGRH